MNLFRIIFDTKLKQDMRELRYFALRMSAIQPEEDMDLQVSLITLKQHYQRRIAWMKLAIELKTIFQDWEL